jgi:UDP-MurNAc hydroxylase
VYETGRDESERIIVESGGHTYDIPRHCPHAGEDLAVVDGGLVHCLAHDFAFDPATGDCANARCVNLGSRRIS